MRQPIGFHLFNYIEREGDAERAGGRFMLFGKTKTLWSDGRPLCVLIGSADTKEELRGMAWAYSKDEDVDGEIVSYFIHSVEAVEIGIDLGAKELNAGEN